MGNIPRNKKTQKHIDDYYYDFETIKTMGLDALIITGANVEGEDLSREVFFDELKTVFKWSYENVASTLCSCLATHAVMEILYQQKEYTRRINVGEFFNTSLLIKPIHYLAVWEIVLVCLIRDIIKLVKNNLLMLMLKY